ncbi:MAG: hypothetical protein M3N29_10400 [Chloroflexota bacterium]|nr:hypothetical protein [Chloroflexota bacterium]
MFRLVRFLAFFVLLVGLAIFLVLPAAASPLLTQAVREMGVQADELKVTVDTFDPALLYGRAARLRVEGRNVALGRATVGRLDLVFGGVSIFDRSFQSLSGRMEDVVVMAGGIQARAILVEVYGPAESARATGHFDAEQSAAMVDIAAERAGFTFDDVQLVDGGLRLTLANVEARAAIAVDGGALVLRPEYGAPIVLLQPAASDPWRLSEAYVSPNGVTVLGVVNTRQVAARLLGATPSP